MKKTEPIEKTCNDLLLSVNATAKFLDFLRKVGNYKFRVKLQVSNPDLEKYIEDQSVNVIQAAKEHLLAWKWINQNGHLNDFNAFRKEVLREMDKRSKEEIESEKIDRAIL